MLQEAEMKLTLFGIMVLATCALALNGTSDVEIRSGQRIAIKMTYSNQWLGCDGEWCEQAGCPQLFFSKPPSECWGEVFNIYNEQAHGQPINVGDKVGLYYPREGMWIGCFQGHCGKYTCPGNNTYEYGMADAEKWQFCGGAIFTIYAFGKDNGEVVLNKDAIMLRFKEAWVSLLGETTETSICPGNSLPPPKEKYDTCVGEAFEIFKI